MNTFSGSFDFALIPVYRDSRGAQDDKFKTFFEKIDLPVLLKIKLTHQPTTHYRLHRYLDKANKNRYYLAGILCLSRRSSPLAVGTFGL